ncbi:hypothetical protein JW992_15170 [candidate division KSB1 bacterium]|nr:hypothetical protein [candidate division KSB1 bacterium]
MKIVILNDELRSEMQMYLALSNHHRVEIAENIDDLLLLMEKEAPDLAFLDLGSLGEDHTTVGATWGVYDRIVRRYPQTKLVGICDRDDSILCDEATEKGLKYLLTRPIRNRELLAIVE